MLKKGIDVSKWQGTIDWDRVKNAGIEFAIIRASYGKDGIDKCFKANIEGAHAAGIPCGAYHYCYAKTVDESRKEAQHFLDVIKEYKFEYPICLDLEDKSQRGLGKNLLTDIVIAFLETLEKAKCFVAIYTNKDWFTNVLDDNRLTPYCHWLAQWRDSPTYTRAIGLWQYTSTGVVDGINGNVDMDYAYNDYPAIIKTAGLNGYTKTAPEVKPAPVVKPGSTVIYVVKAGDTLSGIAAAFKYSGGYAALAKANGIADASKIYPGQKIVIKGASPQTSTEHEYYTAKKGDNLWKIAKDNKTTVDNLAKVNGITNPSLIYPGQKLIVK